MLAGSNLRKLPKYNRRITLGLCNVLAWYLQNKSLKILRTKRVFINVK